MKNTGIVRRIDELGRIIIPKEIRRTLHIHEGDAMEIWLDENNGVTFRKHNEADCFKKEFTAAVASLRAVYPDLTFMVCDRDGEPLVSKHIDTPEIVDTILRAVDARSWQRNIYKDSLPVEAQPVIVAGEVVAVFVAICCKTADVPVFEEATKAMTVQVNLFKQIID